MFTGSYGERSIVTEYHLSQVNDLQTSLDNMRAERDRFKYIAHLFYVNRHRLKPDEIRHASDEYEKAMRNA